MATHDYVIDNSTGANVRADINLVLQAILTNNSSSSAPSTTAAYMWWADTTNGVLKIRNSSDNAWVELLQLDGTLTLEDGSASTPGLAFRDDLNTGIFSSAADTFNVATGGVERMELGSTTIFNEDGADVDFRIEGDTNAHLFQVDAGNDRVGIGLSSPDSLLHVFVSDTGVTPHASAQITLERAGTNYLQFLTTNTGTSGILFGDGDDNDVAKIVYDHNIPAMQFITETGERMRIAADGKVGIGTSAPNYELQVNDPSGTISVLQLTNTTTGTGAGDGLLMYITGNDTIISNEESGYMRFQTSGSERMRISSSGKVGIGTTAHDVMLDIRANDPGIQLVDTGGTSSTTYGNIDFVGDALIFTTRNGSSNGLIDFRRYNGSTLSTSVRIDTNGFLLVGKTSASSTNLGVEVRTSQLVIGKTASGTENGIFFTHGTSYVGGLNYSDSATSLVTSSDERLKKNIEDADDAGNKIDAIKVRKFDWKKTGEHQEYGFVAQELEPVFAHAVHTGEDDFKTKTVDYASLLPMLVKEIQSLRTRVEALETA